MIRQTLLSATVVILAGVLFDFVTNEQGSRSPILAGGVALALYIAASLVMGLLNLISGALYLWLFADKDLSESMLDDLRRAKIRGPRAYEPKTHEYLSSLADDPEAPVAERVKAASMYGAYLATTSHGIFRSLAITRAYDNAVLRYSQEAPAHAD
jgi:hypothetical protein